MSNVQNVVTNLIASGSVEAPKARSSAPSQAPVEGSPSSFDQVLRQANEKANPQTSQESQTESSQTNVMAAPASDPSVAPPVTPTRERLVSSRSVEVIATETHVVENSVKLTVHAESLQKGLQQLTQLLQTLAQMPAEQGADLLVSITHGEVGKEQALAFVKAFQEIWMGLTALGQAALESPEFKTGLLDGLQQGTADSVKPFLSNQALLTLPALAALPVQSGTTPVGMPDLSMFDGLDITQMASRRTEIDIRTLTVRVEDFSSALNLYAQNGSLLDAGSKSANLPLPSDWKILLAQTPEGQANAVAGSLKALTDLLTDTKAGRVLLVQSVVSEFKAQLTEMSFTSERAVSTALPSRDPSAVSPKELPVIDAQVLVNTTPSAGVRAASQPEWMSSLAKAFVVLQDAIQELKATLASESSPNKSEALPAVIQNVIDQMSSDAKAALELTAGKQPAIKTLETPVQVSPVKITVGGEVKTPVTADLVTTHSVKSPVVNGGEALAPAGLTRGQTFEAVQPAAQAVVETAVKSGGTESKQGSSEAELLAAPKTDVVLGSEAASSTFKPQAALRSIDPDSIILQAAKEVSLEALRTYPVTRLSFQLVPEGLGKMTVQVALVDHAVNARILVTNAEVKDALKNHMVELRTALNQAGLQIDQLQVQVQGGGGSLLAQYYQFQQENSSYQAYVNENSNVYRETETGVETEQTILAGSWNLVNLLV